MAEQLVQAFLHNQGLNEKDIKVYLDIYQHGQSFASTTALRTRLDRTTVYSVLKRLVNSGIIAQTRIDGVSAYVPVAPDIFLNKIDHQIEELETQKKVTSAFIDQMQTIKKQAYFKPRIQIYEGEEAIISLYQHSLAKDGQQKAFLTLKNIPVRIRSYLQHQFIQTKITNNVHSQVIVAKSGESEHYQKLDHTSNRQTRIVKDHPFILHSEIILFNEQEVAIIDFHKQVYGIVIQSSTLYQTIGTLFDYLWKSAID